MEALKKVNFRCFNDKNVEIHNTPLNHPELVSIGYDDEWELQVVAHWLSTIYKPVIWELYMCVSHLVITASLWSVEAQRDSEMLKNTELVSGGTDIWIQF